MQYEPIKCFACRIDIKHSPIQHEEYMEIWCEKHLSWCGDHTQKSIEDAINAHRERRKAYQLKERKERDEQYQDMLQDKS